MLLGPLPGTGSSCNRRRGSCEEKANMSMCFFLFFYFYCFKLQYFNF